MDHILFSFHGVPEARVEPGPVLTRISNQASNGSSKNISSTSSTKANPAAILVVMTT